MAEDELIHLGSLLEGLRKGIGNSIELFLSSVGEKARHRVRLCAIPDRFDVDVLGILETGLNDDETVRYFDMMSGLSIVSVVEGYGIVHDEARRHIFSWWLSQEPGGGFQEVSKRLAQYFAERAEALVGFAKNEAWRQYIFHLTGADLEAGFRAFNEQFEVERGNYRLDDCQALTLGMREYETILGLSQTVWLDYCDAQLLVDRRRWRDARRELERLVSQLNDSPDLEVRVWCRLGLVCAAMKDWTEAIGAFERAESVAQTNVGMEGQLAQIYAGWAAVRRDMGELSQAVKLFGESIARAEKDDDKELLSACYNGLGMLHWRRRDCELALRAFERSLLLLGDGVPVRWRAQVYNNLGLVYADLTDWETSRDYLTKSSQLLEALGDGVGRAEALTNLMRTCVNLGQQEETIQMAKEGKELFRRAHDWNGAGKVSRDLAFIYKRAGKMKMAFTEFNQAGEFYRQAGNEESAEGMAKEASRVGNGG